MDKSNIIKEILNTENKFDVFLENYKKNPKLIAIYGAGRGVHWTNKLLSKYNILHEVIIDKDKSKQGNSFENINVISLDEFIENYNTKNFYILVSSPKYENEIIKELNERIENKGNIYSFECELYYSFIPNVKEYKEYLINHLDELEDFYSKLEDEYSKETLISVLKGRITGDLHYFYDVYKPNQYFDKDLINLSENEVILDIGSNSGDTLCEILKYTSNKYKSIYCFEPDKKCLEELNKMKKDLNVVNIHIVGKAAWNEKSILRFKTDSTHGASKITTEDEINGDYYDVETTSIDESINEPVTFIKMDIEGAELNALVGAQQIIKKYRPSLAICVYHKNDDFIKISKYIKSLVPEYKLFLRHHNFSATETVLYAVI